MKRTVPILLLLCGSASADTLTLAPVPSASEPNVVGSKAVCKGDNDFLRVARTKLDGHEVLVLGDCAGTHSYLALETKSGWTRFVSAPGWGSVTSTKLKKRDVLLHRIDTYVDQDKSTSRVDLCVYDDKAGTPSCGSAEVECPETGCREPEIIKGALWMHAAGGRKRFLID
ncbi:MAG TPA: hypothetical protein VMZ53_21345 [Kofleriaceae bacterium]|nr:hypothetical protein [Kofleriaceae bacterium]